MSGKYQLGPDRVARKNIAEPRDFLQKDLDTLSRARADLHATLAQMHLQIDDDPIREWQNRMNAKSSIACTFSLCKANPVAEIDDGIRGA